MVQSYPLATEDIRLAVWSQAISRSALQEMLSVASRPNIISFALGLPAAELFPTEAFAKAVTRVLGTDSRALQYGPPFQPLKGQVVELMAARGVACSQEQVFLTAGAQQGMNLLARLLLNQGSQVLVEETIYTGFQQVIEPFEPQILSVSSDPETGMDVDEVESLLAAGCHPALIYAVTEGHNPLAVSLSAAKRVRLVQLAREYRVPILEDDPYGFLYYDEKPLRPMRALDEDWVLYIGSFSKILAPALRVGWIVVPEVLIPKLSIVKEAADIDTSTLTQRSVSAYLSSANVEAHLIGLRREYARRRDAMLNALDNHFGDKARWRKPSCGFFIWVELASEIDTFEMFRIALESEQVAFIPGRAFSVGGSNRANHCLRLNFSNSTTDRIEIGIQRLGRVLNRMVG